MDVSLNKIKLIVKDKIGLDSKSIGDATLDKIIQQRMHQCKVDNYSAYYTLLSNSSSELNELLELAVIPETWFFRDIRPFEFIYKKIKKQLIKAPSLSFRILSIPCSSGEEPYSLAMYLLDKGLPKSSFKIDAVDISKRSLQRAAQGIYGNNSFRGKHYHSYQAKHFDKQQNFYHIKPNIQEIIKFYTLNILHDKTQLQYDFDFILCRNLLIYFDMKTKLTAFKQLSNFMKNDAYLFIGHSEFGAVPSDIFQNTGFEQSFALIKHSHPDFKNTQSSKNFSINSQVKLKAIKKKSNFESLIHKPKTSNSDEPTQNDNILVQVRELANIADFNKAEAICKAYIKDKGEDAEALFLLGLIASSQKQTSLAESLFRKGLFLEPKHYECLVHLSLLLKQNGDTKNAKLFEKRADKALASHKE